MFGSKEIGSLNIFRLKKFGSFKIISDRFLIKTDLGKILGAERFGCKEVAVASIAEAFGQKNFDPKILSPIKYGPRKN